MNKLINKMKIPNYHNCNTTEHNCDSFTITNRCNPYFKSMQLGTDNYNRIRRR